MAIWEISLLALLCALKLCLIYSQIGKFLIFPCQFGLLAIKVIAFWEILLLALLHTQKMVSYVWSNMKFPLFPPLVWYIGC